MARPALSPLNEPPAWANEYVGLPWKNGGRLDPGRLAAGPLKEGDGLDCWGLARMVAAERFGAELPAYDTTIWREFSTDGAPSRDDRRAQVEANAELAAFIGGEKARHWAPVWEAATAPDRSTPAQERVTGPLGGGEVRPGDVVLIRNAGAAIHVGIAVAPGWMLHIEDGVDAMCVPYDDARTERRVIGFYRWVGERC